MQSYDRFRRNGVWRRCRLWTILGVVWAVLLSSCANLPHRTPSAPADAPLVATLAIYPVDIKAPLPPALIYPKTVDLVDITVSLGRYLVYSYGDIPYFPIENGDIYAGPSLLQAVSNDLLDAASLALVRSGVEIEGTSDAPWLAHQPGHNLGEVLKARAWIEIYHLGADRLLLKREISFKLRKRDATHRDPWPRLTQELEKLMQDSLRQLESQVILLDPFPSLQLEYYSDQSLMFSMVSDDTPSRNETMKVMDEVDQSLALLDGYQYFYPDISLTDVQKLTENPGILVREINNAFLTNQGLKNGDIITGMNDVAVRYPHQLARKIARLEAGESFRLHLMRGQKPLELTIKLGDAP